MANACGIVNPSSGGGERAEAVEAMLRRAGCREVFWTTPEANAEALARRAVEGGCDLIVAAGGDGTVHQAVNGIAPRFDRTALAVVPLGTGNDFARSLAMPADPEEAVERILHGSPRPTDVISAETSDGPRCVINHSTAGFSAVAAQHADDAKKLSLGPLEYLRSAAAAARESTTYRVRLAFDDAPAEEVELYNLVIANGRTVGGGIPIAPEAKLDDGVMDVVIVPAASLPKLATIVPHILSGHHRDHPDVTYRQARSLRIESGDALPFTLDGELVECGVGRFEVLPGALRVVC